MADVNAAHLNKINTKQFISSIENDSNIANEIARRNGLKFDDPLKAVYHYRKHGDDFASVVKNQRIDVYLTKVPASLINDGNLTNIENVNCSDGTSFVRKIYITPDNLFAVVIENLEERTISSMYQKPPETFNNHQSQFSDTPKWNFVFEGLSDNIRKVMGIRADFLYNVHADKLDEHFLWTPSEDEDE
jgi:hypothetical protein